MASLVIDFLLDGFGLGVQELDGSVEQLIRNPTWLLMNLIAVGVVLLVVDLASAYVNPEVYKRLLLREGVPEKMIPHREIEQDRTEMLYATTPPAPFNRVQHPHLEEQGFTFFKFRLAVRKSYRWSFPKLDFNLARVNRIFRWAITFQTQLGRLINAFNLPIAAGYNLYYNIRNGYQRESMKYKGDFSQTHKAVLKALLREASKVMTSQQLQELESRISELELKEQQNIMLAETLTRVD
ncbi:unnamed protein product [Heligmosomoides polygyrus]|uniref:Ion_trans domain-containing protein n=1 Tax=Heligmosomoides polygyrus TaxID=6339 RepID=A0A3P7ZHH9_HELPZ|nr:unnamed protein product [Heligmosomoides polygyrus]